MFFKLGKYPIIYLKAFFFYKFMINRRFNVSKHNSVEKLKYSALNKLYHINAFALTLCKHISIKHLVCLLVKLRKAGPRTDMVVPTLNRCRLIHQRNKRFFNHLILLHHNIITVLFKYLNNSFAVFSAADFTSNMNNCLVRIKFCTQSVVLYHYDICVCLGKNV